MTRFAKVYRDTKIVEANDVPWLPFEWSEGGLKWKLLYTSPGDDRWTVMFRGPKGSYIYPHIHNSEAEGMLFYGQIGPSAAPVGSEPEDRFVWVREGGQGDRHQRTTMEASDTCFYLTIKGPISWITENEDGSETLTDVDAVQVQEIWDAQYAQFLDGKIPN